MAIKNTTEQIKWFSVRLGKEKSGKETNISSSS
jgi:hypothetical protein